MPRHPLLERQLKRIGLTADAPPSAAAWQSLLERLDRTYAEADRDRYTLERSLSLSSNELQNLYEDLSRSSESEIAAHRAALERTVSELSRANLFLDSIVENIPDIVFVLAADGLRFQRINRAAEKSLGLDPGFALGKSPEEVFLPIEAETFIALAKTAIETGMLSEAPEHPITTKKGERALHTKMIPLPGTGGGVCHVLGISVDVTEKQLTQHILWSANEALERRVEERTAELRTAEEQLRTSQKMDAIGRLAGGVAHDFNNMLAVISGCADMLIDDLGPGTEYWTDLRDIRDASVRAASLTQSLLAFSRQQVLQPVVLDLNTIVQEMGHMVSRLIGEDIECSVRLGSHLGMVEVDRSQVQQVLLNLAVNARDAMPKGGRLEIQTEVATAAIGSAPEAGWFGGKPHILLSVSDNGTGMSPEIQARIFEPFFTTKEQGHGTGLGLATVYGIVKQSGGTITVDSVVGEGTTFRVYLPQVTLPMARHTPLPLAGGPLGGMETVLLVEDDDAVRRTIARVLSKRGYVVIEAKDGEQALRVAGAQHFDVLLTDVIMPKMGGRDLAEILLPRHPGLRVMYVSGYTGSQSSWRIEDTRRQRFLHKPFSPSVLLRAVRELLDERGA
jgi:two-component system cell cycle sensor histidine kinase/response regulator CckA